MKTEEEERRVRLEKRLEPNVDFDDALQVLDFTQILSNLGWVRFFMELMRILTRSLIRSFYDISTGLNEGVSCLSFHLEDEMQLVPYGYIGELLGYKKEARSKLMSKKK
jgi:hypothetical protein